MRADRLAGWSEAGVASRIGFLDGTQRVIQAWPTDKAADEHRVANPGRCGEHLRSARGDIDGNRPRRFEVEDAFREVDKPAVVGERLGLGPHPPAQLDELGDRLSRLLRLEA